MRYNLCYGRPKVGGNYLLLQQLCTVRQQLKYVLVETTSLQVILEGVVIHLALRAVYSATSKKLRVLSDFGACSGVQADVAVCGSATLRLMLASIAGPLRAWRILSGAQVGAGSGRPGATGY